MAAQGVHPAVLLQALGTTTVPECDPIVRPKPSVHPLEPRMLYDRAGAARQLSISIRSLDYYIARKQIATRRLGRKVMVGHGELVRFSRMDHFGSVDAQD